jgi:uncharacterized membrane protein
MKKHTASLPCGIFMPQKANGACMDTENNPLVVRLAIYIVCVTAIYLLLRNTLNPLVLVLCLMLILTRAGLVALVVNVGRKRGRSSRRDKAGPS